MKWDFATTVQYVT